MNIEQFLAALNPELVARFKTAIETGKWPDGRQVTEAQRNTCMQAIVAWEHVHVPETERTGYIHRPKKDKPVSELPDEEKPVKLI